MIVSRFLGGAKFFGLLIFAVLFLGLVNGSFACYNECIINGTTDLIAGQHTDVGDLKISNDGTKLYVEYVIDSGWVMSESHLHVSTSLASIPQKNGNPIPGRFAYKKTHYPKTDYFKYEIPLSKFKGKTTLYVAAHAVVCKSKLEIPSGSVYVEFYDAVNSLFDVYINGLGFDGIYPAFCIDIQKGNFTSTANYIYPYTSDIISSLISSPGSFPFDHPENMDLVNYILNKYYLQGYSAGNIQAAIWTLLENEPTDPSVPPYCSSFEQFFNISLDDTWDQATVDLIVNDALANGEGYVPPACGWMGLILISPYSKKVETDFPFFKKWPYGQAVIFICRVPKCECETAWAKGCDFPGSNWAMYSVYKVKL